MWYKVHGMLYQQRTGGGYGKMYTIIKNGDRGPAVAKGRIIATLPQSLEAIAAEVVANYLYINPTYQPKGKPEKQHSIWNGLHNNAYKMS